MAMAYLYPFTPKEELVKQFVGKSIKDVATPVAVLDMSKVKKNCSRMLSACESLGFGWRAHIKTHKTIELTRLQVGPGSGPVNLIVSTLAEAEFILPLLLEYKSQGRVINLLYGFPFPPSSVSRLGALSKALGPGGLSLMIDHPSQLPSLTTLHQLSGGLSSSIFLKIDQGYGRAGVLPDSTTCSSLLSSLLTLPTSSPQICNFLGLYSHAGHSYSGGSRAEALGLLRQEFEALRVVAESVNSAAPSVKKELILSVGATPTTTSIRNLLLSSSADLPEDEQKAIKALRGTMDAIRLLGHKIEVHAGVYPTLDLQQLSTHALPSSGPQSVTFDDLALTIVAEVASLYPGRGKDETTEALIAAGSLALGRDPCKSYPGWGILTPWNRPSLSLSSSASTSSPTPEGYKSWIIGRINQEHGILTHEKGQGEELQVGQKVRIWPNHACITGAGYGWYLVVDSEGEGKKDEIVDIWIRCRGW